MIEFYSDTQQWYRNAGRAKIYHLSAKRWVRDGKAVCGKDLSHAGFVIKDPGDRACPKCLKGSTPC